MARPDIWLLALHSNHCPNDPHADDITISDVSILIDYPFITGSQLGLPDCL